MLKMIYKVKKIQHNIPYFLENRSKHCVNFPRQAFQRKAFLFEYYVTLHSPHAI